MAVRAFLVPRAGTRVGVVLLAALAATATGGSAVLAGDDGSPVQIVRSAPTGDDLDVEDIAGRGDDLAVAWTETDAEDTRSHLRWSRDGGGSWTRIRSLLTPGNSHPHTVRVDICGPYVWAVQEELDPSAGKEAADVPVLYRIQMDTGTRAAWTLNQEYNAGVDLACGGDRFVAVVYELVAFHSGQRSLMLTVRPAIPRAFRPQTFLVGQPSTPDGPLEELGDSVSATNGTIQVAWFKNNKIKYRRYTVSDDAAPVVTPFPAIMVADLPDTGPWGGRPLLAAHGSRVALAYRHSGGGARVRLSDDGATFGAAILSGPDSEAGWVPISIDLKRRRILVELQEVTCCPGDSARPIGLISPDLGETWLESSSRDIDGVQVGALYAAGGVPRIGEAWDRSLGPPSTHQKLRFQYRPE